MASSSSSSSEKPLDVAATRTTSPSSTTTSDVISLSPALDTTKAFSPIGGSLSSLWPISKNSNNLFFLPDFTEHPKPRRKQSLHPTDHKQIQNKSNNKQFSNNGADQDEDNGDIAFFHDFIAGGMAGSASVVVGHPFDTIKVRVQTSSSSGGGLAQFASGGISSLFSGMAAPLVSATFINAIVFSSYGLSSRVYDDYLGGPAVIIDDDDDDEDGPSHDPWQKSMTCGSFAGLVQCVIICPMEHIKCRLQVQSNNSSSGSGPRFKGPVQMSRYIVQNYGKTRLFQGWWATCLREVPAFGMYFASYDYLKDACNSYLSRRQAQQELAAAQSMSTGSAAAIEATTGTVTPAKPIIPHHSHTWIASAIAGGCAGSITWAMVYPIDVIKSHIQTAPLADSINHPERIKIMNVGRELVRQNGWRYMFRGLGITLIRAFPVNGTIFPVYEFTLMRVVELEKSWSS